MTKFLTSLGLSVLLSLCVAVGVSAQTETPTATPTLTPTATPLYNAELPGSVATAAWSRWPLGAIAAVQTVGAAFFPATPVTGSVMITIPLSSLVQTPTPGAAANPQWVEYDCGGVPCWRWAAGQTIYPLATPQFAMIGIEGLDRYNGGANIDFYTEFTLLAPPGAAADSIAVGNQLNGGFTSFSYESVSANAGGAWATRVVPGNTFMGNAVRQTGGTMFSRYGTYDLYVKAAGGVALYLEGAEGKDYFDPVPYVPAGVATPAPAVPFFKPLEDVSLDMTVPEGVRTLLLMISRVAMVALAAIFAVGKVRAIVGHK